MKKAKKMEKLIFKKKRETLRELAHTDVFLGSEFLGYYLHESYDMSLRDWHFVSKGEKVDHLNARNEKEIKEKIINALVNG